jgi:TRAP-type mannitol/chloroaromatic compound transport system permease large subunit
MRSLRLFNPWRGITAVTLVIMGASVAITCGVMAAALFLKDR